MLQNSDLYFVFVVAGDTLILTNDVAVLPVNCIGL